MNPTQYKVGPKASVIIGRKTRVLFKPNEAFDAVLATEQQIANLLAEKRIAPVGVKAEPPVDPALPPIGVSDREFDKGKSADQITPGAPKSDARSKLAEIERERALQEAKAEAGAAASPAGEAQPSSFNLNPDELVGKPIDELRLLALQRDATMEVAHLDEAELIAVLSADYQV